MSLDVNIAGKIDKLDFLSAVEHEGEDYGDKFFLLLLKLKRAGMSTYLVVPGGETAGYPWTDIPGRRPGSKNGKHFRPAWCNYGIKKEAGVEIDHVLRIDLKDIVPPAGNFFT